MGLEGLTEAEHVEEEVVEKEEVKHMFQVIFWIHLYMPSSMRKDMYLFYLNPIFQILQQVIVFSPKRKGYLWNLT